MSTTVIPNVNKNSSVPPSKMFRNEQSRIPNLEEMSGDVILEGPGPSKRYVHMKVYRTSLEHFAVIYPLRKLGCKPVGVLNLKHTVTETLPLENGKYGLIIKQSVFDTSTCLKLFCKRDDLEKWSSALASKTGPKILHKSSCLPVLEEEE